MLIEVAITNSYCSDLQKDQVTPVTTKVLALEAINHKSSSLIGSSFDPVPHEVIEHVASFLPSFAEVSQLSIACKYWHAVLYNKLPVQVLVIGLPGVGKSTLVHIMTGKQVYAKMVHGCEMLLFANEQIPGVKIGSEFTNKVGKPYRIDDFSQNRIIWDCPNIFSEDIGDELKIEGNTNNFLKRLKGKIRIILNITGYHICDKKNSSFAQQINKIASIFPEMSQFDKLISLVVSRTSKKKEEILTTLSEYKFGRLEHFSRAGGGLINFFIKNPDHVAVFPIPEVYGVYDPPADLTKLLQNNDYIVYPQ